MPLLVAKAFSGALTAGLAADTLGASDGHPKIFALNPEVIACGDVPGVGVTANTATTIATGGMIPRGADAVVMIEHTELIDAIGAGDPDLAQEVARKHTERTREAYHRPR